VLFLLIAAVFSLLARFFPRLPWLNYFSAISFVLILFDWLFIPLSGRLSIYAVVILSIGLGIELFRQLHRRTGIPIKFLADNLRWVIVITVLIFLLIEGGTWIREKVVTSNLPEAAPDIPNVLVIVIDTLRADHLSSYGYERDTSPYIDRIAEQGVLFEKVYSTSSWTVPSHASLLTGRYVHEHGADINKLDKRLPTLGEVLQSHGYRTGGFTANMDTFNRQYGFSRGFIHFEDHYQSLGDSFANTFYGRIFEVYAWHRIFNIDYEIGRRLATDINLSVTDWINKDKNKPFFALLNYYDVHSPYIPPQPYRSRYSEIDEPGGLINTDWDMNHIYINLTPEQLQAEIDAYDGAIAYVDDQINALMTELEKQGQMENTLVILMSDHGESFGEHGLLEHHNSLYPEVIHVPLIVWWPEHLPEGLRIDQPVSIASIPSTIMSLITKEDQSIFPEPSLSLFWEQPESTLDWPDPIAEVEQAIWLPSEHLPAHGDMQSIITSDWQYITHEKFGEELYNLTSDPEENNNLVSDGSFQDILEQLKRSLYSILQD
jgi:arylsulfatase A-like enzyme